MTDASGLRIVFAGTPEFAARHLQAIYDSIPDTGHRVVAVYTQPDRPAGRGKKLSASEVKKLALDYQTDVRQPRTLKDAEQQQLLSALNVDIMVVVAYGLLLPRAVLDTPRYGCLNVHASLLPRWRGAAPIQRALQAGDRETGVTIMQMDEGLDTGTMLLKTPCPILPGDTAGDLHDRLTEIGPPALLQTLAQIQQGTVQGQAQDNRLSCYAAKITKEEAAIDWRRSATEIALNIRAFNPFPIAYTQVDGKILRVRDATVVDDLPTSHASGTLLKADQQGLLVACGKGSLLLKNIQLPGKQAMPVSAIINGYRQLFSTGKTLG
ncbi:MAG: methionyl-tRNA formyltransferase [Exilibacterium sp.]